jgi:DNA-binding NarL/FixJ family response regulator
MTTFFTFGLLPLFLVIAVIAWATETREQRIRRFVSSGLSQRAVAKRLNVSRYAVSKALAAA